MIVNENVCLVIIASGQMSRKTAPFPFSQHRAIDIQPKMTPIPSALKYHRNTIAKCHLGAYSFW